MIATWMLYLGLVALLGYLGGRCAEPLAAAAGLGRRWVWLVVMAAVLLLPLAAAWGPAEPAPVAVAASASTTAPPVPGPTTDPAPLPLTARLAALDGPLGVLWLFSSCALALWLVAGGVRAVRARAGAEPITLDGMAIRRSRGFGPSVVGLLWPDIVVPEWIGSLSPADRALLLAHEQAHVTGRDPLLLAAADLLVAAMPWNPGLWLSRARLRRAIELDCDARVLARHADPARYGRLLLDVGDRLLDRSALPAFARPRSSLTERIDAITTEKTPMPYRTAAALLAGIGLVIVAACTSPEPDPFAQNSPAAQAAAPGSDLASFKAGLADQPRTAGVLVAVFDRDGKALVQERLAAGSTLGGLAASPTLASLPPSDIAGVEVLKGATVPYDGVIIMSLKEAVADPARWARERPTAGTYKIRKDQVPGQTTDIVLTVDGDRLTLNGQAVPAADIGHQLRAIYDGRPAKRLVVATTDRTGKVTVERVLAAARDAGVTEIRRTPVQGRLRLKEKAPDSR